MVFKNIEFTQQNEIATIRLNRPDKMNSFNVAMHEELSEALTEVRNNKQLRCLIITAKGKAFSSGQDLYDRYEMVNSGEDFDLGSSLRDYYNPLIEAIMNLPIPVIAAVNGLAAGAGIGLALACDIVVASKSAKFVFAFSKVGLVPDSACGWSLTRAVGAARARALILLGKTISATSAQEMGMIWQCVEDDQLETEIKAITEEIIQKPASGLNLSKQSLLQATENNLIEQLNLEAELQSFAGRNSDYSEAVRAFVEKRNPNFTGSYD